MCKFNPYTGKYGRLKKPQGMITCNQIPQSAEQLWKVNRSFTVTKKIK